MSRDTAGWRASARALGLALVASLALPAAAPSVPAVEPPRVSIGVAAFESVGQAAVPGSDLATLLADRIGTRGVHQVVGPARLGAVVSAEPTPEQIQTWAQRAGVATIAVGRATQIGGRQSIDVRLRAGNSGGLIGTYVAEVAKPEDLGPALDQLAGQIVDATVEWLTGDVAAAPRSGGRGSALRSRDDPFGMAGFESDQPLSIRSDELEASQQGGARRLVFKQNVRVEQADMKLESGRLEAYYPQNASQPERLVASGGVRVRQGTREARCDQATYHRVGELLVCEGHAELRDGDDHVEGDVIEFDLAAERVVVKGGAKILLQPDPKPADAQLPAAVEPEGAGQ